MKDRNKFDYTHIFMIHDLFKKHLNEKHPEVITRLNILSTGVHDSYTYSDAIYNTAKGFIKPRREGKVESDIPGLGVTDLVNLIHSCNNKLQAVIDDVMYDLMKDEVERYQNILMEHFNTSMENIVQMYKERKI